MPNTPEIDLFSVHDVVSDLSVEALIEEKHIGEKLKQLRLKRSMGLVALGELTGLSASYLSQLETGRVVPTLRNLSRIAMAHKVDLSTFFKAPKRPSFKISRAKDRISIPSGSKEQPFMLSQSMSALIPDRRVVPCIAELRPGFEEEVFEARPFQGREFAYVMQGSVSITTLQRSEILEETDVVWIEGTAKREYKCVGEATARVLIISFPLQSAPTGLSNADPVTRSADLSTQPNPIVAVL